MGGMHGGWALTLIDSAGGCAGHSLLPAGSEYTTIEAKANFARPITRTPADAGHCQRSSDHLKRSKGSRP
jgi:uncharacterized protein (TIGR00369 family)